MVTVRIPTPLRILTGGKSEGESSASDTQCLIESLNVRFPEDKIREPVLCQINRAFPKVDTNIRRADVREKTGWMDVEFSGDTAEIERAIEGIRQKGVIVDPIELNVVE